MTLTFCAFLSLLPISLPYFFLSHSFGPARPILLSVRPSVSALLPHVLYANPVCDLLR